MAAQRRIAVVNRRWDELIPDPNNPRKNDAAVDPVAESIRCFGFRTPIIIDAQNNIVAGHTRYKAAEKLGMEEVPCVVADELNEKELKAFQLADNKTAEFSKWDKSLLFAELDDLAGALDMAVFGFDLKPVKEKENKSTKDPQYVICPRCGKRIPRHQTIDYSPDDFEGGDEE